MDTRSGMAAHAQRRVERLKAAEPIEELRKRPLYARVPSDFTPALKGRVIALDMTHTPEAAVRLASEALGAGAKGLAVWVERNFHAGDYSHLDAIRTAFPDVPLLMMDFVIDPWQLERARAGGADAVLLDPALLGPFAERLVKASWALGLAPMAWGEGDPNPRFL